MPTDVGSHATDREARNNYLIDIDDAWENSREALDQARNACEDALEAGRAAYETQQESASTTHRQELRQGVGDLQARGE